MDLVVIVLAVILNPIARQRRKRAALAAMQADIVPAETGTMAAGGGGEFGMTERGEAVLFERADGIDEKKQGEVSDDGEKGDEMVTTNDCQQ